MAGTHNPKLNIYILTLKNQSDSVETFRDLFKAKCQLNQVSDNEIFKEYFKDFLDRIGKDQFRKDEKAK